MRYKQINRLLLCVLASITLAIAFGAMVINISLNIELLSKVEHYAVLVALVLLGSILVEFLLDNKIYKGLKYFWHYHKTKNKLELQMIDAGFTIQRSYYVEIPKVTLTFSDDFSTGILRIRNNLKFDRKLDDVVMSSALGKFIVEQHYLTDDGNYYIYELVDGSVSFKMQFDTFKEFLSYNNKISPYKLFLDKRSQVKLQHCLLVGQTGSGKSYSLYSLIVQMLNKRVPYEMFYADPKGSSLAVIGSAIAEDRTAVDVASIIKLLEEFVSLMRERKQELKERLKNKIDADYSTFGMKPYIFICDEYASLSSVLASEEKKVRDKVKALLYEIILQGRQLGFFVVIAMQKSDATLLDTALRENIPLKIVLGNSEPQTYVTAFGNGVDIPNRHYVTGEGVFTEPELAPTPKLVQFPYLDFDILQACMQSPRYVITGAPEKKDSPFPKESDDFC